MLTNIISIIMEKQKSVIIVILAIILTMGLFNFFVISETNKIVTVNEIEFKVPNTNNNVTNQTEHYSTYEDVENGIFLYVFDSQGTTFTDAKELFNFLTARDVNQLETIQLEEDDYTFNYSRSLNEYTYLLKSNKKNIFVITKNKEDMLKIIKSIKNKSTNKNKNKNYQEEIIEDTVNSTFSTT